jgi:hypothetical protein
METPKFGKPDCLALGQKLEAVDERNSRGHSQEELGSLEGQFRLQSINTFFVVNSLMCSTRVFITVLP